MQINPHKILKNILLGNYCINKNIYLIFKFCYPSTVSVIDFTVFNEILTSKNEKRNNEFPCKVTFALVFVKKSEIVRIIYLF